MDKQRKIKVYLENATQADGHVDLRIFLQELGVLQAALTRVDKRVYGTSSAQTQFLVTDLSHSSPAMLEVEPRHIGNGEDKTDFVVKSFADSLKAVAERSIPEDSDYELLETLKKFAAPIGNRLTRTEIVVFNEPVEITKAFARTIDEALERGETCFGSVEGALEQINIHGKTSHFTIYPAVGPSKVKCIFPDSLHEEAISCIDKPVLVSGELSYRPHAAFPHQIAVEDILLVPSDSELPTFDDLLGIIPSNSGAQTSEEAIREVRDGWE